MLMVTRLFMEIPPEASAISRGLGPNSRLGRHVGQADWRSLATTPWTCLQGYFHAKRKVPKLDRYPRKVAKCLPHRRHCPSCHLLIKQPTTTVQASRDPKVFYFCLPAAIRCRRYRLETIKHQVDGTEPTSTNLLSLSTRADTDGKIGRCRPATGPCL